MTANPSRYASAPRFTTAGSRRLSAIALPSGRHAKASTSVPLVKRRMAPDEGSTAKSWSLPVARSSETTARRAEFGDHWGDEKERWAGATRRSRPARRSYVQSSSSYALRARTERSATNAICVPSGEIAASHTLTTWASASSENAAATAMGSTTTASLAPLYTRLIGSG